MLRLVVLLSVLAFGVGTAHAQLFWPENLGDSVNTEYPEVNPVMTKGGDTLFFSRINSPDNRYGAEDSQDIWMSVKGADGAWKKAERLPDAVNIARYNALYSVLADGKSFLIAGVFDKHGKMWLRRGFSIVKCDRGNWSKPERVHVKWFYWMNEGDVANAYMTPDGKFLYMAMSRRYASDRLAIYVSQRQKGKGYVFSRPKRVKGPMADFFSAETPVYSEAHGRLYFAARKNAEDVGDANIFAVSKSGQNNVVSWDKLVRLSDTVNSAMWESYFVPSPDGTRALLCSDKEGGFGKSDIYNVMLTESRPWVYVKGRILDAFTKAALPMSAAPVLLVNGEQHDSMQMRKDSAYFEGKLPLGERYVFTAQRPHCTSDTVVVDMSNERLYHEATVDLTLTSLPYVHVKGVLINSIAMAPIEARYNPTLLIDGQPVDSAKIDPKTSAFSVNLPFGRKYQIAAKADEHTSQPAELDLTRYHEYTEVPCNAFARLLNANMVTLKGTVINTKTGKPLEPGIDVKMRVNRVISDLFRYDNKTANYTMMLPAGADYDLIPSVKNFYNKLEVVDLRNAKPRSVVQRNFFVMPLEVGQSVDIENIFFETAKSTLKPESYRSLNALVEFFNEYPNVVVEIGGHTDNVGGASYNKKLSQARAASVAEYIIQQGISRDRFRAKGYGFDKPKASNKTAKGRAQNRRVDFTILGI